MKTTVLEDKLFKMLKDNLADLWQDDLIAEAGQKPLQEKWSQKYKSSINCSHPKGFSQKAHCAGKKKHNEDITMEAVCPDCGMCQTHGTLNEIKKGQKDANGYTRCWPGKHAEGTKKGKNGGQVRKCVPNEGVAEGSELSTSTLTGEIPTAMGPRKREQRELIEKYALYNKERDYFELFSELSDKPMPEIYNMNDSHQLAYELYNLGSQIASDWKNIGNPTFSRREYLIQIMADWYNLFKKSIQKYKSMAQGVAEGGPYDLPGKDYDRAGDAPHKPSRAKNNPYPFSKEEDDDYFREIFRKKREAKEKDKDVAEDWNKVNHHDHTNGLSQKAVNSYRREHPGSKLKTAVTTKPSKLKAGSKAAKRRKSFCARMGGNKGPMKTPSGKPTPKALALRRWHCESLEELLVTARQRIYEAEGEPEGLKHLTPHLAKDILDQIEKEGVHAIVKSIEWGDGGAKELINIIKRELKKVAND